MSSDVVDTASRPTLAGSQEAPQAGAAYWRRQAWRWRRRAEVLERERLALLGARAWWGVR